LADRDISEGNLSLKKTSQHFGVKEHCVVTKGSAVFTALVKSDKPGSKVVLQLSSIAQRGDTS
jgi:hypothetical protein